MYKYDLVPSVKEYCYNFAIAKYETTKDQCGQRGQWDKEIVIKNSFIGAMGEIGAGLYCRMDRNIKVPKPDFTIKDAKDKSFSPDLLFENLKIHVKSCERNQRYPSSWTFQATKNRVGGKDPVLKTRSDLDVVIFCEVDNLEVEVKGCVSVKTLIALDLFKPPRLQKYREEKICVYYEDIKKLGDNLLWSLGTQVEKQSS